MSQIRFLTALTLFVLALPAAGQDDALDLPSGIGSLCFGLRDIQEPRALEVCDALALRENVRARELAQQWLRDQPDSPAAQFAFAEVLFTIEGNMARALYHLNQAEALTGYESLEEAFDSGNVQWHYLTLTQLSYVHQLMGNQPESLRYLDKMSEIYGQDVESYKGWPLLKLKEYDAARASAERVLETSTSSRERARAWNTLCAVDLASLAPIESMHACEMAINEDPDNDAASSTDTVYLTNAAEVSLSLLRIDEAEAYLDRASRYLNPDSVADPWIYKLYLTLNQGRFDEARQALDRMLVWRNAQEPIISAMNRAEHFLVSASFLLLAGYPEDAAKLTQTALNQPDRNGSYSADDAQKDSYAALVNGMALRLQREQLEEERAMMSWGDWFRSIGNSTELAVQAWQSERRAAALFADEEVLKNRLRPYAPLDVHIPEWVEPEIIRIIGPGVMSEVLESALADGAFQLNRGYYHAYRAEIAALTGNRDQLVADSEAALAQLPNQEVLLRARLTARLAEQRWQQGINDEAQTLWQIALQSDPSITRRLSMAIPVRVDTDGSALAEQAGEFLLRSPRFIQADDGFVVSISAQPELSGCLQNSEGDRLACYTLEAGARNTSGNRVASGSTPQAASTAEELARDWTRGLHAQAFSLGFEISKAQRSVLLGSSVILSSQNDQSSRQRREQLLNK